MEGLVYGSLERGQGVSEAEGHDKVLVEAAGNGEGGQELGSVGQQDVIEARFQVKLYVVAMACCLLHLIAYIWQRISVLDHPSVKLSVVHAEAIATVLGSYVGWAGVRAIGLAYEAMTEGALNVLVDEPLVRWGVAARGALNRLGVVNNNVMLPLSLCRDSACERGRVEAGFEFVLK